MKRQFAFAMLFVISSGLMACHGKYENTTVVKMYKSDSGADPSSATVDEIAQYLHSNKTLEDKLRQPCAALAASADSSWQQSSEGKICTAVRMAAFFQPLKGPDTSDKSTF